MHWGDTGRGETHQWAVRAFMVYVVKWTERPRCDDWSYHPIRTPWSSLGNSPAMPSNWVPGKYGLRMTRAHYTPIIRLY